MALNRAIFVFMWSVFLSTTLAISGCGGSSSDSTSDSQTDSDGTTDGTTLEPVKGSLTLVNPQNGSVAKKITSSSISGAKIDGSYDIESSGSKVNSVKYENVIYLNKDKGTLNKVSLNSSDQLEAKQISDEDNIQGIQNSFLMEGSGDDWLLYKREDGAKRAINTSWDSSKSPMNVPFVFERSGAGKFNKFSAVIDADGKLQGYIVNYSDNSVKIYNKDFTVDKEILTLDTGGGVARYNNNDYFIKAKQSNGIFLYRYSWDNDTLEKVYQYQNTPGEYAIGTDKIFFVDGKTILSADKSEGSTTTTEIDTADNPISASFIKSIYTTPNRVIYKEYISNNDTIVKSVKKDGTDPQTLLDGNAGWILAAGSWVYVNDYDYDNNTNTAMCLKADGSSTDSFAGDKWAFIFLDTPYNNYNLLRPAYVLRAETNSSGEFGGQPTYMYDAATCSSEGEFDNIPSDVSYLNNYYFSGDYNLGSYTQSSAEDNILRIDRSDEKIETAADVNHNSVKQSVIR